MDETRWPIAGRQQIKDFWPVDDGLIDGGSWRVAMLSDASWQMP
jgi:hypothetical protein